MTQRSMPKPEGRRRHLTPRLLAAAAAAAMLCFQSARGAAVEDRRNWPQFRGPERNGQCSETGLLQHWPEDGPPLLWSVNGLGRGFSSPILVGEALYISGDVGDDVVIFCCDLQGNLQWQQTTGRAWRGPYPGARATCTWHDGRLYHIDAHGTVSCLDARDGRPIWQFNMLERYQAENIKWGISECPLVDGDRLLITPGGPKTLMVALDPRNGRETWRSPPLAFIRRKAFGNKPLDAPKPDTDNAGYASPIAFEVNGKRLIASASARHYVLLDADSGAILWTREVEVPFDVIGAIPVVSENTVLFTAPYIGSLAVAVAQTAAGTVTVRDLWENAVDNCQGSLLRLQDRYVGSGYNTFRGWACLDAASGEARYSTREWSHGTAIYADKRLYVLGERGTMNLVEAAPDRFITKGTLRISDGRRADAWAHPVICNGRLYLRYHDTLSCYDIRRAAEAPPQP